MADIIERTISSYLTALRSDSVSGRWEAPIEGWALGWLLIRNVEAVIEMARRDEVLVTAAWSNTRVAFEQSARIIWMLQPDDRYEAECRWLAFLAEYEKFERDMAREILGDTSLHSERADAIREFRSGVAGKLPAGYRPARIPSFRDMLKVIKNPDMYRYYREGSQYVHGSMYGSQSYRRNLGTYREVGEFTYTVDWILPMRLCWLSVLNMAIVVLDRLDLAQREMPNWDVLTDSANAAFESLAYAAIARRNGEAEQGSR